MSLFLRPFLKEMPAEQAVAKPSLWKILLYAVWKGLLLLVAAAVTVFLFQQSYPKVSHSLLAWLALAPFTWAVLSCNRAWSAFLYSWLTGTAIYAVLYTWIYVTCVQGGGLSSQLALAAWLGLSALMALQFAIFGVSCFYLKHLKGFFPVLAAMGWVALEWGHEMLAAYILGFPWFNLAYSQWNFPQVLQIASFTGAAGVSFVIAFVGTSVGYAFFIPYFRKGVRHFVYAACVFLGVYGYGVWALAHQPHSSLLRLRAAIVQPNIDQYRKWNPEFEQEIRETLDQMSAQLAEDKTIMLTVWPESVTPGSVQDEPYKEWVAQWAQQQHAWQVLGSNREAQGRNYVSAFLFSSDGQEKGVYDKTHLVPFGEFIPFENTVRRFFPQVTVLGELGGFIPGAYVQPLLTMDQVSFGSTICYESVFPRLWRSQAKSGARFFVNLTNDAWFFDTAAPYQHLAAAVLRAVELRRPVLRAANTGISAFILPSGVIAVQADLNTRATLKADLALPLGLDLSFYGRWGAWFAWICAAFYFTILLSAVAFVYE